MNRLSNILSRRQFLVTSALTGALPLTHPSLSFTSQAQATPIEVGAETQLFVDDQLIAAKRGLRRTLHPARKLDQPVIVPDKPWEGERVYNYGTVHFDPQSRVFRMWYLTRLGPGYERRGSGLEKHGDMILYATSKDGLHWEKPSLGLHEFDGKRANNILLLNFHSPSVLIDPQAAPGERYKMAAWNWDSKKYGYWVAHSADGLAWQEYPVNPVLMPDQELLEIIWLARHPRTGDYFAFHRRWKEMGGHKRRVIAVATSRDFRTWSDPAPIILPDKQDDAWVREPHQRTEFYNLSGFWYGGQFLGLLPVFKVTTEAKNKPGISGTNQSTWDRTLDVQLAHSRDGRKWERFEDRSPIIPNGPPGSYDAGAILGLANAPVIHNDEVWFYYTAVNTSHGGPMPPKRITIARASWRLDGFVSLDADAAGGTVETLPLKLSGAQSANAQLSVNADAARGSLAVEVLSADGQPLPGYALNQCNVLRADRVRQPVSWKGRNRLPAGQPVLLRFHLKNTKLYSFQIS